MPLYTFTAINPQGQEINGSVEAPDQNQAAAETRLDDQIAAARQKVQSGRSAVAEAGRLVAAHEQRVWLLRSRVAAGTSSSAQLAQQVATMRQDAQRIAGVIRAMEADIAALDRQIAAAPGGQAKQALLQARGELAEQKARLQAQLQSLNAAIGQAG